MIRINLLPVKALQAEVTRRREITLGVVVLGGALALMVGTYLYQSYTLSQLEKELAVLRQEIQALNIKVKEVGDLQNKIKDLRSKNKIIEDLNRKKSGPVLVMESLSAATPASLWLTDWRESGGSVTMNGIAADNQTIADFMRALTASKYFAGVELIETTQGSGPTASLKKFSIKAGVVYRLPEAPSTDAKAKVDGGGKKTEKAS
ncbi:MAG TPA: PilN domain-containing protein [Candidatus Binatia bacterium]|nr:PilN domain-containing protein [Candidatus Binatia bacterium]